MILAFQIYHDACRSIIMFHFMNDSNPWYTLTNTLYSDAVAQAEQAI